MRAYTDFSNDEYSRVQKLQNQGIVCPHCGAEQGHYGLCPLIARDAVTPHFNNHNDSPESFSLPEVELKMIEAYRPKDISNTVLSEEDSIRLSGLGVLWDSEACYHPIC